MKKNQRALSSDSKIQAAMNHMKQQFSMTDFTEWKSRDITSKFRIGGMFPSVLRDLGAIKTEFGKVMLTERINTLRPSTVRKRMKQVVDESRERNKHVVKTPKVSTPAPKQTTDFDQVIIAIKQQVREEIISELLNRLK